MCYPLNFNVSGLKNTFFFHFRAAQKVASTKSKTMDMNAGGYCGALQRAPPPVPPALARRLANRENLGFGKVSPISN